MNQIKTMPKYFVVILAMLTSISPLAIDVYLPSFTQISDYFYTSIDQVEITLSIYLLGFAFGQLLGGPLSDRYGRKAFIFAGLGLYIVFSFLIPFSSSIEQLWFFRFLQALGGGFAVVNTQAIVRDSFHGKEAAKVFSIISMIMMIAPLIAPVIGITILSWFDWKSIFYFLVIYAVLLSYFITKLPETSPKNRLQNLFENYFFILKNKKTMILILANGLGFSGLFIFITKSSFIYMEYFEQSQVWFGVFFSLNVVSLMIFSKVNILFLEKYEPFVLFIRGIGFQLCIAITLLLFADFLNLYMVVFGFMLYIGSLGFVFGNGIMLILEDYKSMSATATALNAVIGFMISALLGFLASFFHDHTLVPIFMLMSITSLLSLLTLNLSKRL